jgi:Rrf2 family protein
MKLTTASEYGCLALLTIAENEPGWCKRQEICRRFAIPLAYLEQLLRRLAIAGFIVSRRGSEGGFRLARPASEIEIAEIVRAMDGPIAPVTSVSERFYQPSPVEASPAFHALFRQVRDVVAEILEHTTLEDIVEQEKRLRSRVVRRDREKAASVARSAGSGTGSKRRTSSRKSS